MDTFPPLETISVIAMPPRVMLALLLVSLLSQAASYTLFFLEGQITCNLNREFDYQVHVIEEDPWKESEISRASFVHASTSPSRYNITAMDTNDGVEDYYYEIWFLVYHNCQDNGKHMYWYEHVGEFWVYDGTHYRDFNFDITNKGVLYDW